MFFFEFPVIRLHIWLVFDVPLATAMFRHDDPFVRESLGGCAHAPLRHCGTVTWVFTFSNRLTMATKLK